MNMLEVGDLVVIKKGARDFQYFGIIRDIRDKEYWAFPIGVFCFNTELVDSVHYFKSNELRKIEGHKG